MINYRDYKPMIVSRALAWSQVTGWDLKELISEGNLAFCKATRTWDGKKASFSTWLYVALNMHYHNMLNQARTMRAEKIASEDSSLLPARHDPEREAIFWSLIKDLPEDALEIIKACLETPSEIIEVLGITRVSRHAIFRYFTKLQGWSQGRVRKAFRTIQETIR